MFNLFSYLSGLDNRRMTQALRTFCDYLIIESTNKSELVIRNVIIYLKLF